MVRKDIRRPRFSFFRFNCQTAGQTDPSIQPLAPPRLTPEKTNPRPDNTQSGQPTASRRQRNDRSARLTGSAAVDEGGLVSGCFHVNRLTTYPQGCFCVPVGANRTALSKQLAGPLRFRRRDARTTGIPDLALRDRAES